MHAFDVHVEIDGGEGTLRPMFIKIQRSLWLLLFDLSHVLNHLRNSEIMFIIIYFIVIFIEFISLGFLLKLNIYYYNRYYNNEK